VAFARALRAWLAGGRDQITVELGLLRGLPDGRLDEWQRGELAWWGMLAGDAREPPGPVAEPFGLMLAGRLVEAARAWERTGSPAWAALAGSLAPGLEEARQGLALLEATGSPSVHAAVLRERHDRGLPVPRPPRRPTRGNPAGLTARELEVLVLLADGLTNAEAARRLFVSEKTVDHHVSAVLRKLGEPTRARAVAASYRRGILQPNVRPNLGRSPDVGG
jgi:DNA-binding CsgD family transcriptional regulator